MICKRITFVQICLIMANEARKLLKQQKQLQKALKKFVPVMGNEAVKHFKKSFKDGGFTDNTLERWKPRKRSDRSRRSRAILVKSGDLKRSIRVNKRTFNSVTIGSKTAGDYGEVHNDGLRGVQNVGSHTRRTKKGVQKVKAFSRNVNLPKRQFIGDSKQLTKQVKNKVK